MKNIGLYIIIIHLISCGKKFEETKPIRRDVTETVFASGHLEATQTYQVVAQSDGYLIELDLKENDLVKKGQVLGEIDNKENQINTESATTLYDMAQKNLLPNAPKLAQAKISMNNAKRKMEFEEEQTIRLKKLWEMNSIPKIDYENALLKFESAKAEYFMALENLNLLEKNAEQELIINRTQKKNNELNLGFNKIKAIAQGKVYKKWKEKGDFVKKGDIIATIGDESNLYAMVSIDESSIARVKIGQDAIIQLNIDKEKNYKGKVAEILPAFNEETQSFLCKITFSEKLSFNILNTQLQVNIVTGKSTNALLIPRKYLQYGNFVTVKDKQKPIKVETKFISSEWVQVLSGIDENVVLLTEETQ